MGVFAFGSNGSGQLGIGHAEDVSIPTECLFTSPTPNDKIVNVVAGGNHTLILTESGAVYAAGCNTDGRCGPGIQTLREEDETKNGQAEENILLFRRIFLSDTSTLKTIDTFKCVSATWEGSILVPSTRDKVFVLGSTPKGELGLGKDITMPILDPGVSIPNFPPRGTTVASLASGMGHTVAILSNGEGSTW
jgi:protein ATS1